MSQAQELGLRTQVLDVVPPGPIHRHRRSVVAKFAYRIPNFREPGTYYTLNPDPRAQAAAEQAAARRKDENVSRLRPTAALQQRAVGELKVPVLLEQREGGGATGGAPAAVFKGVPEAAGNAGGASSEGPPLHYILFRSDNRVIAFPAEQWLGFKPHVDRRGLVDSVAAANAAAAAAGVGGSGGVRGGGKGGDSFPTDPFALRLVPKSQRLEKQRQEEEARERQEQVAAGRLLPLAGAVDELGAGGGRLRRFVDDDELEAELFGDDEEDEGPRNGGRPGKGGKQGRGRSLKNADGEELGEDEVPEDLYGGPGADAELRPEKPEEAEDWEHEFAPDDDDQDQGADDEVYEDDPGMRKKLGIEADDEDEGEEADEQARKLKKLGDPDDSEAEEEERKKEEAAKQQQQQQQAAAGAAAGGEEGEAEDEGEEEEELDELDADDESPKPPPRPPSAPPLAAKSTPPPPPAGPVAAAPAAAPPAAAAGTKRKGPEEPRGPQTDAAKRARTATPPPPATAQGTAAAPGAVKPAAGATGAVTPAAQRPTAAAAAGGAAPGPAVTAEEVVELLRRQPGGMMRFQEFTAHFAKRITTPELRSGFKSLTVSLCKSSKNEANVLMVSLKK